MAHIILTSANMGSEATAKDFESWCSFVCENIDDATGETCTVEWRRFGESGDDDIVTGCDEDSAEEIRGWLANEGWDAWCSRGTTLRDMLQRVSGGIIQTDRGNGSAGPLYLGEELDDEQAATRIMYVTEAEDPDAWRLAREALEPLGIAAEIEIVAVGERDDGDNGYQAIFVG